MIQVMTMKAYKVSETGVASLKINLSEYMVTRPGMKYFQAKQDDGTILLIPEENEQKYREKVGKK